MRWLFHSLNVRLSKTPFSRSASKMSRHFVADAHRGDGKRFIVHADEKLSAFVELERVSRESLRFPNVE